MSAEAWQIDADRCLMAFGGMSYLMKRSIIIPGFALFATISIATAIRADSIGINYSLTGTGTVVSATDTTLTLDTEASGSILSTSSSLNALWNPINYSELCVLDLTTNLLQGNFTITLQDGDTFTGTDYEDDSVVDASPTQTGPFPQTLTFTGGTGEFAGATGSVSGIGFLGTTDFTVSGSGDINTSAVPEPASGVLLLAGLVLILAGRTRRNPLRRTLTPYLAGLLVIASAFRAKADPVAYVETSNPATGALGFGTLDLQTGAFQSIGSGLTNPGAGLVPTNGSLLTLGSDGNLYSINPVTGVETTAGQTGLADCSAPPASPCGLNSANALGSLNGKLYVTDYAGNLYGVNATTGHATLIGLTGLPAITFQPFSMNADGTLNVFDESLFDNGGKLYANTDVLKIDPNTGLIAAVVVPDKLYQIDPGTGQATVITATTPALNSFLNVNGTEYAFDGGTPPTQILDLDLANGSTNVISSTGPSTGLIFGAALATPEPSPRPLLAAGLALVLCSSFLRERRV